MPKHQYAPPENMVGWLKHFADRYAEKNDIKPEELTQEQVKDAGTRLDNILTIMERNKVSTVEAKVQRYRELVGLDMVDSLQKESNQETEKTASRTPLSIRDKIAQQQDGEKTMANIKQYIADVIKNRNGTIATPAILEQLENYLQIDREWLRNNYEDLKSIIEKTRKEFHPQQYRDVSVEDLTRTDDQGQSKEKEAPPITTQTAPVQT